MHPNVERVVAAGAELGVAVRAVEFPEGTRTAEDAARAVGCDLVQIVKSLVFTLDGELVMALVAGTNRLEETRLAEALGGSEVGRADAAAVKAATGYAIGGVPPFGHADPLRTVVDEDLLALDEVWAAAGTPHHVFAIAPADLLRVTGGRAAALRQA
ncbi:MAG TPA: YbaK/EbsC family protein [Acidimicrobiales bacterium]|nr:YbaK/EbsC family protein [Acidimicrobiales bacterium]